ncbi:MAG TPA: hypothetical protein PK014_04080 [Thermoanaerobaculia bacterium]|nr:hypothetical protein [Thermoanaerobaculia bacterium]HUM29235.1 hypothetical protein [Thermoanaerobaculia bacterium]HXK67806.1 hypothetical protein [Thermoanaerobaculia bacterium]
MKSSLETFLNHCSGYWSLLKTVHHTCPGCGSGSYVQFLMGEVRIGYTYAAGTVHFSPEETIDVPELERHTLENGISVCFHDRTWTFTPSDE